MSYPPHRRARPGRLLTDRQTADHREAGRPSPLGIAAVVGLVLALSLQPSGAQGAEPFDGDCQWDAERGTPLPLIITGFATGSATPPAAADTQIAAYARELAPYSRICVVGQADKRGAYAINDVLAMRRARAVAARLIAAGIEPDQLSISSRAESFGDGMPKWFWAAGNRRVEIVAME